jgi:hypothetical protein
VQAQHVPVLEVLVRRLTTGLGREHHLEHPLGQRDVGVGQELAPGSHPVAGQVGGDDVLGRGV